MIANLTTAILNNLCIVQLTVWAIELMLLNDVLHFDTADELIQLIVGSFNDWRVLSLSSIVIFRYPTDGPVLIVPLPPFSCNTRVLARITDGICSVLY